jgi:oligoribonuclease NrnB/cAMP/cGMP phosphodiesterase (DHH superfamily)
MAKKNIIVSHSNCPDGAASAIVAKTIVPSIEYVRGYHDRIDKQVLNAANELDKGGSLWIVDISCNKQALEETCEIIAKKDAFVGVYEHHVSQEYLATFELPEKVNGEIIFDNNRCGAKIFYERMIKDYQKKLNPLSDFIRLTNDRDLWINNDTMSAELSSLHNILGDERFVTRFFKNPSVEFSETESVLLKYEKERLMKRMHYLLSSIKIDTDKDGYRYGVMIGEGKASEVCNVAIHKFDLEYVCMVDFNSKRASIRSHKEFDCAAFSKVRGGGGHVRAAGFPIKRDDFKLNSPID